MALFRVVAARSSKSSAYNSIFMAPVTHSTVKVRKPRAKKAMTPAGETPIYSIDGSQVGSIALPEAVFGAPWRGDLVHQVTTAMQANIRQNRAHTKDRSEVSGGGKKPWKQKGTGQARHGSTRSPIWRHGGITFGPRSSRDYSEKINRKMRVGALLSALSRKAKEGEIILVKELAFAEPKAKQAKTVLGKIGSAASANLIGKQKNAALIAFSGKNTAGVKSFGNFGNIATEEVRNLNPLAVLSHKYLVIENPEVAFETLKARTK